MGKRRKKRSGLRRLLRSAYRALSVVNTASYVLGAGSDPLGLVKHLARKRTARFGSRLIK